MCGFRSVWLCECVDFVKFGCVYVWILYCEVVCIFGFSEVWVCVCVCIF